MSQAPLKVRNLSPMLQKWRNFLLGREHVPERAGLRYSPLVSARTQPDPNLPEGDAHKLSANYYVYRDGRREAAPPTVVADNRKSGVKLLSQGEGVGGGEVATPGGTTKGLRTPGPIYRWD